MRGDFAVDADLGRLHQLLLERFPRVAFVHEWLTIPGGSEQVLIELLRLFPDAEIFTSVYDPSPWPEEITNRQVTTSYLDRLPFARRFYPQLVPLMGAAFEGFDLSGFDLVISSSHAYAKSVLTPPGTVHVCYCHTPPRYAWEPRFLRQESLGAISRAVLPVMVSRLRRQDLAGAARPDHLIANSTHVAARIEKYYRRTSTVIHPPVDVSRFASVRRTEEDFYVFVGRLVPYKRADLAVKACTRLKRRLKVIGDGRGIETLREQAGPSVEFLGRVDDEQLVNVIASARAVLFPGEEDFGIVPVEARAAGVPVIAYTVGGIRDSVRHGESGMLFPKQSVSSLCDAIVEFEAREWDEAKIREGVERFGAPRFRAKILQFIGRVSGLDLPSA